jgi:hypothetical protein
MTVFEVSHEHRSFGLLSPTEGCVATLRAKVEVNPHNPEYIQAIRDIGSSRIRRNSGSVALWQLFETSLRHTP